MLPRLTWCPTGKVHPMKWCPTRPHVPPGGALDMVHRRTWGTRDNCRWWKENPPFVLSNNHSYQQNPNSNCERTICPLQWKLSFNKLFQSNDRKQVILTDQIKQMSFNELKKLIPLSIKRIDNRHIRTERESKHCDKDNIKYTSTRSI